MEHPGEASAVPSGSARPSSSARSTSRTSSEGVDLVHSCVDDAAARNPDHPAVVLGAETLSYGDLSDATSRLADALVDLGVERGDRVGLYVHKSFETVIGAYGIMKAGAAFVPIDPQIPVERLAMIVDDCGIEIVVTERRKLATLDALGSLGSLGGASTSSATSTIRAVVSATDGAAHDFEVVDWPALRASEATARARPSDRPSRAIEPDDLAYIMYTSGSTGVPKGMMHSHRSSLGFGRWGVEHCGLVPSDRVASHGPLHFDISIFDIFSTGIAGATVVLVPEPVTRFPASLSKLLEEQAVTALFTVPFAFMQLVANGALAERSLTALRWVLFGGEPFPARHLRSLMHALPQAEFSNVYGPAEAPACVTHTVVTPPDADDVIPIGQPSPHTDVLVVEPGTDRPVEPGAVGELLVAAPSITLGYWNRPERNAVSYLHDDDRTYFRTGDLVSVRPDGIFDFLGRGDRMVKTRGFRVELDEIEAAISSHPLVAEAAAFTSRDEDDVVLVHAAFTTDAVTVDESAISAHAAARLPSYAMPVSLTRHESFPRTTSDKIDRTALAEAFTTSGGSG